MESDKDLERRLAALEIRVDALEGTGEAASTSEELSWILKALPHHGNFPAGSVIFAGEVDYSGRRALYQWHHPTHVLTDESWEHNLSRLAALAHPVRGGVPMFLSRGRRCTSRSVSGVAADPDDGRG